MHIFKMAKPITNNLIIYYANNLHRTITLRTKLLEEQSAILQSNVKFVNRNVL